MLRNPNVSTKVFEIGLARTGTTSLFHAMEGFGFACARNPSSWAAVDECQFANDTTIAARFDLLDQRYHQAKFLYATRALDPWVQSCLQLFHHPERPAVIAQIPTAVKTWWEEADILLYGRDMAGLAHITEAELIAAYHRHDERVKRYFQQRPEDCLEINVTEPRGLPLTQLVGFLEQHGLIQMPHANPSGGYQIQITDHEAKVVTAEGSET